MMIARSANAELVRHVAKELGEDLLNKSVFLGGTAVGFLITDPAAPDVRATTDVDIVVEVVTQIEYHRLEQTLTDNGFVHDTSEDAPICRWRIHGVAVDVMPTDCAILGFSNKWYGPAVKNAEVFQVDSDLAIRLITAPYFLATKIVAFHDRGNGDYFVSHDVEDIIALLDGRAELVQEITELTDRSVQDFLAESFRNFLQEEDFIDCIPGHLFGDAANQRRAPIIVARVTEIANYPHE